MGSSIMGHEPACWACQVQTGSNFFKEVQKAAAEWLENMHQQGSRLRVDEVHSEEGSLSCLDGSERHVAPKKKPCG